MNKILKKFLADQKIQIAAVSAITFLVYVNSLFNGLVWDDHLFLEQWPAITSTQGIGEIIKGSAPPAQDKVYRPIRGVFYVIDYQLWKTNPFFYHLQAVLMHVGITVLVYLIALELLSKSSVRPSEKTFGQVFSKRKSNSSDLTLASVRQNPDTSSNVDIGRTSSSFSKRLSSLLPFVIALLFGLHPIHTETINYISASMETWGSLFFFVAFFLYIKASGIRDEGLMWLFRVGSVLSALVAFFTYEMTLTLPLLLVLAEFTILSSRKIGRIIYILPYFVAAGIYLFVRIFVLDIVSRGEYLAYSFYHTMLVMVKVFLRYILLLFVPVNQTAVHNLVGEFPSSMIPYDKLDPILSQTLFDFDILASIVILVGLIIVALRIWRIYPLISFGILWFFIALLPVSFIIPMGGAMAEKYLYIASFGFIVAAVSGALSVVGFLKSDMATFARQGIIYVGIGLVLYYSISTIARNRVWKNDITLFSDVVKKSPNNLLANYTLGIWFSKVQAYDAATAHYSHALNLAPEFWEARYNLANVYLKQGKFDDAKVAYSDVLKTQPKLKAAQNILDNLPAVESQSQEASPSAKLVGDELFLVYNKLRDVEFDFPVFWAVLEGKGKVILTDSDDMQTVEVYEAKRISPKTGEDYVKAQKETFGTLVNEGPAQIPNVDSAWVKVWSFVAEAPQDKQATQSAFPDQGIIKLQFFLFKGDRVVQVFAYPVSNQMQIFDLILGSIKIE